MYIDPIYHINQATYLYMIRMFKGPMITFVTLLMTVVCIANEHNDTSNSMKIHILLLHLLCRGIVPYTNLVVSSFIQSLYHLLRLLLQML